MADVDAEPVSLPCAPIEFSRDGGWSHEETAELYNVSGWGAPYFSINAKGHLSVHPTGDTDVGIDAFEVIKKAQEVAGLTLPVILKFPEIVSHKIQQLQGCYATAIQSYKYGGDFRGVFPVKCNHDCELLRGIMETGPQYGFGGLEVGSKAELVMALSILQAHPGALLICNGYKDADYMTLLLQARLLGINAISVTEQLSEVALLLQIARQLGVRPAIGVRAKLHTRHGGHWGGTSGAGAKFGLRPCEIVALLDQLGAAGMLDCLHLLHFHIGSQITNTRIVKEAMREASFLYAELYHSGARSMAYMDVGGGLGIDYDGSFSDSDASVSYTMQNYANDVVSYMQSVVTKRRVPPPTIISESGRALASHHAIVIMDVLSPAHMPPPAAGEAWALVEGAHGRVVALDTVGSAPELLDHIQFKNAASAESAERAASGDGGLRRPSFETSFRAIPEDAVGSAGSLEAMLRDGASLEDTAAATAATAIERGMGRLSSSGSAAIGSLARLSGDGGRGSANPSPFAAAAAERPGLQSAGGSGAFAATLSELNRLQSFRQVYEAIRETAGSLRETYDDATYYKEEASRAFKLGVLGLKERAQVDVLFDATCERIREVAARSGTPLPLALQGLHSQGAQIYHVNFSVFRSMLDSWAIHQLFPIMPIHRLEERPSVAATLADLTCDSDGKIDRFISRVGDGTWAPALWLHALRPGEPYLLAVFCTGVYQELLGSDHNMIGSVHTLRIRTAPQAASADGDISATAPVSAGGAGPAPSTAGAVQAAAAGAAQSARQLFSSWSSKGSKAAGAQADGDGTGTAAVLCGENWVCEGMTLGERVEQVLAKAGHHSSNMLAAMTAATEATATRPKGPNAAQAAALLANYKRNLASYTYLRQ